MRHRAAESSHAGFLGQYNIVLPCLPGLLLLNLRRFCNLSSFEFSSFLMSEVRLTHCISSQGWFALAPLGLEVATSMGTCENQLFPPTDFPTRPAYLKFKNLKSGLSYCQYGVLKEEGQLIDCKDVPADVVSGADSTAEQKEKYRPQVLAKCVCTPGTECKSATYSANGRALRFFLRIYLASVRNSKNFFGARVLEKRGDCERGRCLGCFDHLREDSLGDAPRALWPRDLAAGPTSLTCEL